MSLQGPIVIVSETASPDLLSALRAAGASSVVEIPWSEGPAALAQMTPVAIFVLSRPKPWDQAAVEKISDAMRASKGLYTPVIAFLERDGQAAFPGALPIAAHASAARVVARLVSALRVREQHATAIRRAEALQGQCHEMPELPQDDPLEEATVLVAGRGRTYPTIATAVGERVSVIGALSLETAAKYLNARDIDGLVITDGFGPRSLEAFLIALTEDTRFRDLPVVVLPELPSRFDPTRLPNLEHVQGNPQKVAELLLPLVRQHAFAARLRRQIAALETRGLLDPQTGLFTTAAFLRELNRAVVDAQAQGCALSLARFSFPSMIDRRLSNDAARLVSRLVRNVDFACRASDGSILVTFSGTALRSAHVVARRIASILRHTMLASESHNGHPCYIDPTVTLATLKAADTVESLLARVSEPATVAAA